MDDSPTTTRPGSAASRGSVEAQRDGSLLGRLKHAFAVDPPGPVKPTESEQLLVDRLAEAVVRRGMAPPALMFLECSRPLNYVASQFLVFIAPLARLVFDPEQYKTLTGFLEKRGSIETLCRRIEELADEPKVRGQRETSGGVSTAEERES